MGAVFTWFVASEAERADALEGWTLPVMPTSEPTRFAGLNPFTKQVMVTWRFEGPAAPDPTEPASEPDYDQLPHFSGKLDLEAAGSLLQVLTGRDAVQVRALLLHLQLKGPPGYECSVHLVPADIVQALALATDFPEVARKWVALEQGAAGGSTLPEVVERYERVLMQVAQLAIKARVTGRDMFVHCGI